MTIVSEFGTQKDLSSVAMLAFNAAGTERIYGASDRDIEGFEDGDRVFS